MGIILQCIDCPFNNTDCVYCKTCDIPFLAAPVPPIPAGTAPVFCFA